MVRASGRPREPRRAGARGVHPHGLLSGALVVAVVLLLGAGAIGAAAPAAAQVTARDFPTSEVTPEDALAYVVVTLDEESEQWQQATALLDRAGLGDPLRQAWEDALAEAGAGGLPLDAFLGGEVALVVTEAAFEAAMVECALVTVVGHGS